jgi:transcriptional regulator with XRE-family HTH domain
MSSVLYVDGVAERVLFLAEWRALRGWSQARLAREAGVSRTTVSNLELGKADGIEWPTLDALASALGATRGALFDAPPEGKQ